MDVEHGAVDLHFGDVYASFVFEQAEHFGFEHVFIEFDGGSDDFNNELRREEGGRCCHIAIWVSEYIGSIKTRRRCRKNVIFFLDGCGVIGWLDISLARGWRGCKNC